MKKCRQCEKELPNTWTTDICLECSRENVRKIFKENPEVKQAFKESIEEMKKPENIKKMADDTAKFMKGIQNLRKGGGLNGCRMGNVSAKPDIHTN